MQLTAEHRVATDVFVAGSVSNEEAEKIYSQGWKAPEPYIRVPSPGQMV